MRIAFVGKGGSGKTTLASLFCRSLARTGSPVLAIDADINQHLGASIGFTESMIAGAAKLGEEIGALKEYVRGENPRIRSAQSVMKTTPPGTGSRLMPFGARNPIFDRFETRASGIRLIQIGAFAEEDLGVRCFHSKTGAVEILLNHLIDGANEYVVVDMTAGADAFASGLFTKFDLTVLVVEPTVKSVGVYEQYARYAKDFGVRLAVVGNKIESDEDVAFLRERTGAHLLDWCAHSPFVRAAEKGNALPLSALEAKNRDALMTLKSTLDGATRDWTRYLSQTIEFHLRNARGWANAESGEDLSTQIDPSFDYRTAVHAKP